MAVDVVQQQRFRNDTGNRRTFQLDGQEHPLAEKLGEKEFRRERMQDPSFQETVNHGLPDWKGLRLQDLLNWQTEVTALERRKKYHT